MNKVYIGLSAFLMILLLLFFVPRCNAPELPVFVGNKTQKAKIELVDDGRQTVVAPDGTTVLVPTIPPRGRETVGTIVVQDDSSTVPIVVTVPDRPFFPDLRPRPSIEVSSPDSTGSIRFTVTEKQRSLVGLHVRPQVGVSSTVGLEPSIQAGLNLVRVGPLYGGVVGIYDLNEKTPTLGAQGSVRVQEQLHLTVGYALDKQVRVGLSYEF